MPELPEVETVRKALELSIKSKTISHVELKRVGLRVPFPEYLPDAVRNAQILRIERRAKYLLIHLSNKHILLAHLGMSGRFSFHQTPQVREKHDHAVFNFTDGSELVFNDARRFGVLLLLVEQEQEAHPLLSHLGPEPLDKAFSPAYLKAKLLNKKTPIKQLLMDQGIVVGVGNIYASEALFLAGIHPANASHEVAGKAALIVQSIQEVLKAAIASGGSSLRDFASVNGDSGYFQHHFNVYGKSKQPCPRCAQAIEVIRQGGRSSFFCAKCQK